MEILTPRLLLRPLNAQDGQDIARATDESWEDLSRWMRWATDRSERTDVGNCTIYAKLCGDKFHSQQDFVFGGFSRNSYNFILTSRLALLDKAEGSYEFCGYWCRTSQQNKGYMTEAVQAIIQYAFDNLQAKKLYIRHAAGNQQTRAIMDKLGFIEETILPGIHKLPNGQMVDEHVLSLSA